MAETEPTPQQYRLLCTTAARIHRLAPWEWMTEEDFLGVRHPDRDQTGWVYLLGMLGEYCAVAVLLGDEALEQYRRLHEYAEEENERAGGELVEIPQLHLALLVDRDELLPEDRQILKITGLSGRSQQAWPQFRAYGSGLIERALDRAEATFLQHCLDQVLEVAPRIRDDEEVLFGPEEDDLLVRVWQDGVWVDRYETPAPAALPWEQVEANAFNLSLFRKLRRTRTTLELGFFHVWAGITEDPDLPPYYPYLLVAIDAADGRIVGMETLRPAPSFAAMWQQVPSHLARLLGQAGGLPATVLVDSDRLKAALGPLLAGFQVTLVEARSLPHLDEVRHGLAQNLSAGEEQPQPDHRGPGTSRPTGGPGLPGPLPLPTWADLANPLDLAAALLHRNDAPPLPKEARAALEKGLRQQQISADQPGTVLRDVETLLRVIGNQPLEVTASDGVPRGRFMAAANDLLVDPFPAVNRQPQPRSFPNVRGLYHLMLHAGFGQIQFDRPVFLLQREAVAEWRQLNPTEQYFALLETWLLSPDPDPDPDGSGLLTPILRFLELEADLAIGPCSPLASASDYDFARLSFGLVNLTLAAAFGLVKRTAAAGRIPGLPEVATAFGLIEATSWGQQLGACVELYLSRDHGRRDTAQDRRAGGLMPALQRCFPAWQRRPSRVPWLTAGAAGSAVTGAANLTVSAAETAQPAAPPVPERRPAVVVKVALGKSWRRLALPADRPMRELAQAVLEAFDLDPDHPCTYHRSTQAGEGQVAGQTRIDDLKLQPGDRLVLRCDLADPLLFRLQVEEVGLREGSKPELLEGQGRSPAQAVSGGGRDGRGCR